MNTILSNTWIADFLSTYSIAIAAVPTIVTGVLKIVAMLNPNVPTDKIRDLLTPRSKSNLNNIK